MPDSFEPHSRPALLSQLVAVDVIFKHGLLHEVADHRAEGTHSMTLLVLLQFGSGYSRERLLTVTTHQRPLGTEIDAPHHNR